MTALRLLDDHFLFADMNSLIDSRPIHSAQVFQHLLTHGSASMSHKTGDWRERRAIKQAFIMGLFLLSVSPQFLQAQTRDTVFRDVGVHIGWRSLLMYPNTSTAPDVIRNFQLGAEVRVKRFWLQTIFAIGWNRNRSFEDDFNIDVTISAPYQISLLKGRAYFGVGPIFNYYVHRSKEFEYNLPVISVSHAFALGPMIEFTVPIWQGLSIESASDIGIAIGFSTNNSAGIGLRTNRIVSIGLNYRFNSKRK